MTHTDRRTALTTASSAPGWLPPPDTAPEAPDPQPSWFGTARLSAVTVAAVFGGILVMASAVAAAAARWGTTPVTVRLLLLGLLLATVTAASELVARRIPVVGRVLIHLAALLVLPTAITSTAQLGGSWRTCLLAGGLAATAAVAVQGRRRAAPLLVGATALGMVVASAGLAALVSVPIAVLMAIVAATAATAGLNRRATFLALVAAWVPALVLLTNAGVGRGTLREMGATGPTTPLGAVIAGLLGAAVLGWIARSTHSKTHAWGSVALLGSAAVATTDAFQLTLPHLNGPIAWGVALITGQCILRMAPHRLRAEYLPQQMKQAGGIIVECMELVVAVTVLAPLAFDHHGDLAAGLLAVGTGLGIIGRRYATPAPVPAIASVLFAAVCGGRLFGWTAVFLAATLACAGYAWALRRPAFAHAAAVLCAVAILVQLSVAKVDPLSSTLLLAGIGVTVLGVCTVLHRRLDAASTFAMTCMALALVPAADKHWSADTTAIALVLGLALAEWAVRRMVKVQAAWFVPALAVGSAYLVTSTADGSPKRLAVTLVIGLVMLAVGAVLEHRPALWAGVVMGGTATVVAAWDDLSSLPTWVWAMAGGLALLVLAGVLEMRRSAGDDMRAEQ